MVQPYIIFVVEILSYWWQRPKKLLLFADRQLLLCERRLHPDEALRRWSTKTVQIKATWFCRQCICQTSVFQCRWTCSIFRKKWFFEALRAVLVVLFGFTLSLMKAVATLLRNFGYLADIVMNLWWNLDVGNITRLWNRWTATSIIARHVIFMYGICYQN